MKTALKIRFECCPCGLEGLTESQIKQHNESIRHELGLALESIRDLRHAEEATEHGPSLQTANAETYVERAIAKIEAK